MNGDRVFQIMSEIGRVIVESMAFIGEKIVDGIKYLYVVIGDWLETVDVPIFSKTKILSNLRISGALLAILVLYIVIVNIKTYKLFEIDKHLAVRNGKNAEKVPRISEARLLWLCFRGGALGGFLGMKIKRHKTQKKKFTIGVTLMLIIQLCIYSMIAGFLGFWLFFR